MTVLAWPTAVEFVEFAVVADGYMGLLTNLISAAQSSINLQAFIPDVVPPGTVGFLMDNFHFSYETKTQDCDGDHKDGYEH